LFGKGNAFMGMSNAHLSVVLSLLVLSFAGTAQAETTYVVAGSLVDPLQGKAIASPVVEIEDDRIVSVTSDGDIPDGANVIDLGDATILPGLADLHTHLTWYTTDLGFSSLAVSETDEAIRGVINARKTLMAGFTAAIHSGEKPGIDRLCSRVTAKRNQRWAHPGAKAPGCWTSTQ
jgi:imidazolonepropionase-like amidohydrolase